MRFVYVQPEGNVRCEALGLVMIVYKKYQIPEILKAKIYDCLVYSTLKDGCKLVKLKALSFWDLVIKKQLDHEGIANGIYTTAPTKDINGDHGRIENSLQRVLDRVNEIGGLYVFLSVFETEVETDVIDKAVEYMISFANLLKRYNLIWGSLGKGDNPVCGDNEAPSTFLPIDMIGEYLDLETLNIVKSPKQSTYNNPINKAAFLKFVGNFDDFSFKRLRRKSSADDLNTVLSRIFLD